MKLLSVLALGLFVLACDENPETPPLGSLSLTTSATTIQQGFATSDGWAVSYAHFFVNVSAVNVAGNDGVLTASSDAQIFDLVPPDPQPLVSSDNRIARAWENVSFEIGPATADSALVGAVTDADRTSMVAGGFSVLVQGTMTRGTDTKTFTWGFTPDSKYETCTGPIIGTPTPGLVVPANGADTAAVGFTGDVLFFDNLVTRGHVLRGEPIANADANKDGAIDNAELAAVALETARMTNGLYEALPGVADLNGFMNEQARSIVATFRETGSCTLTPVTASADGAASGAGGYAP